MNLLGLNSWLVKIKDGKPGNFLRGSDLGLPLEKRPKKDAKDGGEWEFDPFISFPAVSPNLLIPITKISRPRVICDRYRD